MGDAHAISSLIKRDPGYIVHLKDLMVCRMLNGKYHVVYPHDGKLEESIFDDPTHAAYCFINKRRELGFGLDIPCKACGGTGKNSKGDPCVPCTKNGSE